MFFLFSRSDPDFHQGHINSIIHINCIVLYQEMTSTDKSDISHGRLFMTQSCENCRFSIIAFQLSLFCKNYHRRTKQGAGEKP